jgi:hypothetical protein
MGGRDQSDSLVAIIRARTPVIYLTLRAAAEDIYLLTFLFSQTANRRSVKNGSAGGTHFDLDRSSGRWQRQGIT